MKKFIPYIFITAFIGAFMMISFSAPFSGIPLGSNVAEAQQTQDSQETEGQNGGEVIEEVKTTGSLPGTDVDGSPKPIAGGTGWGASFLNLTLGYGMASIASLVYFASGMLVNLAASLLEMVISFTVVNFGVNIKSIGVIDTGYKIILNVANMIFIFILLYMAIKTILGDGGDVKKLLAKVIMVALFINFSLFMTKVIIDASTIMSIGFLNAIKTESVDNAGKPIIVVGSVATAFMSGLRLQTQAYDPNSKVVKEDPEKGFNHFSMTIQFLAGSAFNAVVAFVFFAVSFLFITRFVALLFYMIFSPVAFLGYIAPELQEYSKQWWKGFQSQVIFAPAFLLIAYLVASVISSGALWKAVNVGHIGDNAGFFTAIGTGFKSGFPIIMNFVILIALIIGGLIAAKKMASEGSAGMVGYADKARGWMQGVAGRNTLGRAAYLASKSEFVNNLAAKSPTFGGFAKARLEGVADRKFGKDSGKGYSSALKDNIKSKKDMADSIAKSKTRGVDKSIREEQSLVNEREMLQFDLSKAKLESEKKVDDWKNDYSTHDTNKYDKLREEVKKSRDEYRKLADIASRTMDPDDLGYAQIAHEESQRDEANLENEGVKLQRRGADMVRYENAKLEVDRDSENLEKHQSETAKIQKGLENLTKQRDNIRDKMKREYAKNLPFAELGKSLWGDNLAFLDEIFPSYTDAANEIRKGKSTGEKEISEMIKKLVDEEVKKQSASGTGATPP